MARGTLAEAAKAMEARLLNGDPESIWSGAALDSRKVEGGELFFALAGERTDGHLFAPDALDRGAAAAVVERDDQALRIGSKGALLKVTDTFQALHQLTRAVRGRTPERLIGVTGSAGKTSTKELLAAMLATTFRVAASPGNLNNLYGFPLALLAVPDDCEWMVAEMGMSTPGELAKISRLGRPDVAVFTNVRAVHLEFFDDLGGITKAKAELLEGLAPGGLVVANADDPEVRKIAARHEGPLVWYGLDETRADDSQRREHFTESIEPTADGGSRFVWCRRASPGEILREPIELSLFGLHNVENFLAAAACASRLGVPAAEISAAAQTISPAPMRGVLHRLSDGSTIVDDSYNSNPDALNKSLEATAALAAKRHWAVLGSMLELGDASADFHHRAGESAARLGFSPIFAVGQEAREIESGARAAGSRTEWFSEASEAAKAARKEIRAGDAVLVKGSRGVGLEAVVSALLERREGSA